VIAPRTLEDTNMAFVFGYITLHSIT